MVLACWSICFCLISFRQLFHSELISIRRAGFGLGIRCECYNEGSLSPPRTRFWRSWLLGCCLAYCNLLKSTFSSQLRLCWYVQDPVSHGCELAEWPRKLAQYQFSVVTWSTLREVAVVDEVFIKLVTVTNCSYFDLSISYLATYISHSNIALYAENSKFPLVDSEQGCLARSATQLLQF